MPPSYISALGIFFSSLISIGCLYYMDEATRELLYTTQNNELGVGVYVTRLSCRLYYTGEQQPKPGAVALPLIYYYIAAKEKEKIQVGASDE